MRKYSLLALAMVAIVLITARVWWRGNPRATTDRRAAGGCSDRGP